MPLDGQQAEDTARSQPAESIADRVAAQFGLNGPDESEEQVAPDAEAAEEQQADDETAPAPEEFAEVEYEGGRYQVPKALEKAFLAQKDYTQKTQKLSEREREFNVLNEQARIRSIQGAFERELEPEIQKLKAYDSVLSQPIDWNSMSMEEMVRQRSQRDQWRDEREALARTLQVKFKEFGDKQAEAFAQIKAKALESAAKLPGWTESSIKDLREYGKTEGYSEVELTNIDADPRHIRTLHKAMQYDKLMASKAKAVQTANKAPPMVKPGTTRPMPQGVKNDLALARAQKSAKDPAARARIIQQRLEGRF
jgi:hypothetical protein